MAGRQHRQTEFQGPPVSGAPFRIGYGFDSHRLAENRRLVLCGVTVPFEKGLLGHSDADAPVHALIDAILGALALADIGHLFPDNDPAYAGADSIQLLKRVMALDAMRGWTVGNADLTIIAQAPKMAPHIDAMRKNLADALQTDVQNVSVKAKTAEKLGPVGRGESMEAHAVVLLYRQA